MKLFGQGGIFGYRFCKRCGNPLPWYKARCTRFNCPDNHGGW